MSDKPSNGAGSDEQPLTEAPADDAAVEAEAADDDEDEIPVEVEQVETRPVKVPDLGAALSEGAADAAEPAASAELSHEDLLELIGQTEQEKAALQKQLEELGQKLEAAEAEKKDHYERLLRTVADMENLRKRTRKDIEDSKLDVRAKALKEILPVIDNLERAVTHAEQTTDDTAGIIDGIRLVMRQFGQALERLDVKPIDAKGKPFDPNIHEAVSQAPSPDVAPGSVLEVLQTGYTIGPRLLRPSLVVVAQAMPGQQEPEGETRASGEGEAEAASAEDAKPEPTPMPPADDDESEPEPEREA